jgi:hypothetical protein
MNFWTLEQFQRIYSKLKSWEFASANRIVQHAAQLAHVAYAAHSIGARQWPRRNGVPVCYCGWGLAKEDEEATTSMMVGLSNTRTHHKEVGVERW